MKKLSCLMIPLILVGCDLLSIEPEPHLASIEIHPQDTVITRGDEVVLRLIARDSDGGEVEVPEWRRALWKSPDTDVIQIRPGPLMKGRRAGHAEITASMAGLSTSTRVSVNPIWSEGMRMYAYITQGAQNPIDPVPSIANRKGLLRIAVILPGFHLYEPPPIQVKLIAGQTLTDTVLTQRNPTVLEELDESRYSFTYNLDIPAEYMVPGLSAHILHDPEDEQPGVQANEIVQFEIRELPTFRLRLVPIVSVHDPALTAEVWTNSQHENSRTMATTKWSFPSWVSWEVEPRERSYTEWRQTPSG